MNLNKINSFPKDFILGVATSAYQIEGATKEDGRGESTWDVFCRRPGKTLNSDNGDRACDHYHRYKEDVGIMSELGGDSYRFSIAWPRVQPLGEGPVNQRGIDFYSRLVDELLEKDIIPAATLFHWDLPQALQSKYTGFLSKETSKRFTDYTEIVVDALSDRVDRWMTLNEVDAFTIHSHLEGEGHAPGLALSTKDRNQTVHNALLAHGMAVSVIREKAKKTPMVGFAEDLNAVWPYMDDEQTILAAKKAFIDKNQQILFPVLTGEYSQDFIESQGEDMPEYDESEMKTIGSPIDFVGYNVYQGVPIAASDSEKGWEEVRIPNKHPRTDVDWPITPKSIYYTIKYSSECFNELPVYITENGMCCYDDERFDGEIYDLDRIEYLRQHLQLCSQAIQDGLPLKGYYLWSLLDNFEWYWGYAKRFGIVRVNYNTMERKIKKSGRFYQNVIKNRSVF